MVLGLLLYLFIYFSLAIFVNYCFVNRNKFLESYRNFWFKYSYYYLIVDEPSKGGKDWRAGRCAEYNIVPTTIEVVKAVEKILNLMENKFDGFQSFNSWCSWLLLTNFFLKSFK